MEIIETDNHKIFELVDRLGEIEREITTLTQNKVEETIQKMKETEDVSLRQKLFENVLYNYVINDGYFELCDITDPVINDPDISHVVSYLCVHEFDTRNIYINYRTLEMGRQYEDYKHLSYENLSIL